MKKSFLALASFAAIAVACQVEKMDNELPLVDDAVVYTASTEAYAPATKTAMDGLDVVWSAGDQIAVFQGVNQPDIFALDEGVNTTSASFVFEEEGPYKDYASPLNFNMAYYPYSEDTFYLDWGDAIARLGTMFSDVQKYTEDSFANGAFPMIAVSETNEFAFKNILGLLKLSLKGTKTIKSITVAGNNSQVLAGQFIVMMESDAPSLMTGDIPYTSVTLDCDEGVELNATTATDFYIALPETEFENGFTLTIIDSENNIYKKSTTASNSVRRSSVLVMPEFDIDDLTPAVEFEATASLTDADISFTIPDEEVIGFYGFFASKGSWDSMGSYFADASVFEMLLSNQFALEPGINIPCNYYEGRTFEGKLSEFGWTDDLLSEDCYNYIYPDAAFHVMIIPVYDDKETYSVTDALMCTVSTVAITTGGDIALPNYRSEPAYTSVAVNFESSTDAEFGYYGFYKEGQEIPSEDNYIDMLVYEIEFEDDRSFALTRNLTTQEAPGTSFTLCVMLGGSDGKTKLYTINDIATKTVNVDESLTVEFDEQEFDSTENIVYATIDPETIPDGAELYYAIGSSNAFNDAQKANYQGKILDGTSTFFKHYELGEEDIIELSTTVTPQNYEQSRYVFVILVKDDVVGPMIASNKITFKNQTEQN